MTHDGDNRPTPLRPGEKLALIEAICLRHDLTLAQAMAGVWMLVKADRDGNVSATTADLQTVLRAKRRETVFAQTKHLRTIGLVSRDSSQGQRGQYCVLPMRVMEAVEAAYREAKTGTVKQDHTGTVEPHQLEQDKPVRSNRTSSESGTAEPYQFGQSGTVKQDRSDRTSTVEPYQSRGRTHARKESPSGILSTLEVKNPPKPPVGASDDLKKTNVKPVDSFSVLFADPHLNEGIEVVDGSVRLVNGTRAEWLKRFGGDEEALDLAVMEAAGGLQPNSKKPIKPQIERVLAKIVRESRDKDKRYAKAAEKNRSESRQQRKSTSESIMEKVLPYTRLGQAQARSGVDDGGHQGETRLIDGRCKEVN